MDKKVSYWLDLADDDVSVVKLLISGKKYLQAGFFCHLIAEKSLKAMIASATSEVPPKIHDLAKLSVQAGIFDELSDRQQSLLKELNPLNIDGRYPEYKAHIAQILTSAKVEELLNETEAFLCWTKKKLGK